MAYEDDAPEPEPPQVRRLRVLVTVLMLVLIAGIVIVVAVLVIRLGAWASAGATPVAAKALDLPAGADIVSTGRGEGTVLFVLRDADGGERLHAFDARTGAPLGITDIRRCETPPCTAAPAD